MWLFSRCGVLAVLSLTPRPEATLLVDGISPRHLRATGDNISFKSLDSVNFGL